MESVAKGILSLKKSKLKDVLWKVLYGTKCGRKCGKDIKIIILNTPCYGFGDIIFATKLRQYLKDWYSARVLVASTRPQGFMQLGMNKADVIPLKAKERECRRLARLKASKSLKADLYFVAPMTMDYEASQRDVEELVPYANKLNTWFFSEYNDVLRKDFDFPTGVGGKRYGLLLTDPKVGKPLNKLKHPYAVIYMGVRYIDNRIDMCWVNFLELVTAKYTYSTFEIVTQDWIIEQMVKLFTKNDSRVRAILKKYPRVRLVEKDGSKTWLVTGNARQRVLVIRQDILPVSNPEMLRLIKHSVRDILLTGDQSITDALSCCSEKNIFYQIVPWKDIFALELAKHLPNKYLLKRKTSCGTIKAIKYSSSYDKFVREWDFRKLARPKLDALVLSAKLRKTQDGKELAELILDSRTLSGLKKKIREEYE